MPETPENNYDGKAKGYLIESMITEKDIELIEKHIFGKSSEQEKNIFEQRIKDDKEFAQEVAFIRDLKISSREFGREELKNKLKKIAHEHKSDGTKQNPGFRTYFAIAASIVAVIGIVSLLYWTQSKNDTKNIAGLLGDSIEVNRIIANSVGSTKYFNIISVGSGYGYAETDSSANNKLPVLIIASDKYIHQYLYKDTLFLFLQSAHDIHFFSFNQQPNLLYFSHGNDVYYYVELKTESKIHPIKRLVDKEVIEKIRHFRLN